MRRLMYSPPHDTRPTVRYTDPTEATSVGLVRVPVCPKSPHKSCYRDLSGTSQAAAARPTSPKRAAPPSSMNWGKHCAQRAAGSSSSIPARSGGRSAGARAAVSPYRCPPAEQSGAWGGRAAGAARRRTAAVGVLSGWAAASG